MPEMLRLLAKIGPLDLGVADRLLRRAVGDLLAGDQHDEPGRKAHHRAHDVLDQDDRDALLVEAHQHRQDLLDLGRREPCHRLVGKQQPRGAGDRTGELELAHFDLGQIARQPGRLVGEPDIVEQCETAVDDGIMRKPRTGPSIDGVKQRNAQIVDEVEAAEGLGQLKAAREPEPRALVSRQPVDRAAVKRYGAAIVVQCAAQAVDQGALARAVGPDQAEPLARIDRKIDAFERDKAAKALAEPADFQQWRHQRSRARLRARNSPTMPLGAMMTKAISNRPTIKRLSAEEIVTVASCWIVPSRIAPITGPAQLVMPPINGIATLLTA